jgi:hypothetical protein
MTIKFEAIRWDEPSPVAPGAVHVGIKGTEGERGSAVWPTCADQTVGHVHGKSCAQALLDAKCLAPGGGDAPAPILDADGKDTRITPREALAAWFDAVAAKEAERAALRTSAMPQKTVQKVVDGETKNLLVDDLDLS